MSFTDDLEIVSEIFENFLAQNHVIKGLNNISTIGITGWEKWWQIELGIFLNEYSNISEWDMEHEFEIDRRVADGDRLYVDFGFTKENWKNAYVFLELKQNSDYKKCITQMFDDAEKFETLKSKSTDGTTKRNVYVVGMFEKYSQNHILQYFNDCMKDYGFKLKENEFKLFKSNNTNWMTLIF